MKRTIGYVGALITAWIAIGPCADAVGQIVVRASNEFEDSWDDHRWTRESTPAQPVAVVRPVPKEHVAPYTVWDDAAWQPDLNQPSDWITPPGNPNFFRTFHHRAFQFSSATKPVSERAWEAGACGPCRDIWQDLCRDGACCGEFGVSALDWMRRRHARWR